MEVACQLGLRNASLRANWLPRLQNEEADALTNSDFRHFSENRRIPVVLEKLEFIVLNDLFQVDEDYVSEPASLKAKGKRESTGAGSAGKKRPKRSIPLREKDPWL